MPELCGIRAVPQLMIDGSEEYCPELRDRSSLEVYLEERLRKSGRSILSAEYHPPREKDVRKLLLVEVHTVNRAKVLSDLQKNLVPILENGILESAKAANSIRKGSDTIGPDTSKALSFWNDLIIGLEVVESIDGKLDKKATRLLDTTTEHLEAFGETVTTEDPEMGADTLEELGGIAAKWVGELERLVG